MSSNLRLARECWSSSGAGNEAGSPVAGAVPRRRTGSAHSCPRPGSPLGPFLQELLLGLLQSSGIKWIKGIPRLTRSLAPSGCCAQAGWGSGRCPMGSGVVFRVPSSPNHSVMLGEAVRAEQAFLGLEQGLAGRNSPGTAACRARIHLLLEAGASQHNGLAARSWTGPSQSAPAPRETSS